MNKTRIVKLVDELYKDSKGYQISFQSRKNMGYHDSAYTYGEVTPGTFIDILEFARPKNGENFYDLGSGMGKAVVLASLGYEFGKASGIEYFKELHEGARILSAQLTSLVQGKYKDVSLHTTPQYIHADFVEYPWSDADIVFVHATCFHEGMIFLLIKKFEALKKGARVIIVSKQLPSSYFTQIGSRNHVFSWGEAAVNTYIKDS